MEGKSMDAAGASTTLIDSRALANNNDVKVKATPLTIQENSCYMQGKINI